jgi:hypothetical protein
MAVTASVKTAKTKGKRLPGQASIDVVATIRCCNWTADLSADDADVEVALGGRSLGKLTCDVCGSEYTLGVIAQSREDSLASERFEEVAAEVLDEAGVDQTDYEPSVEDVAMCFGCDGSVDRQADWCPGCKEFVCRGCRRYKEITPRRHPAEAHTQPPKPVEPAVGDDDGASGSLIDDSPDFRAER